MMQYQQQHAEMQAMRRYQAQTRESNPAGSSDNHTRSGRSAAHHRYSVLANVYAHGTTDRLAPWAAYPPLAERRSPANETESTHRRPPDRIGGPRSSPSARSFDGFRGSVVNGSPQNSQGTNTHNGRHPATLPVPPSGPGFEIYLPSFSMVSQPGTQPEQFQNPLAGVNSTTAVENFRGTVPPQAPTMAGPEVHMT
ncbi:hypothetical protein DL770_005222 [Monosporascus sp. CRB-9-2]|nr:hypothetical protein DL770_005222 [Monosporascus sp. CRB-9-2]